MAFPMPNKAAFKGDNGKFLKAKLIANHVYLEFSSENGTEEEAVFETRLISADGSYSIKSRQFWTLNLSWICAGAAAVLNDNESFSVTPIPGETNTIALGCKGNKKFCERVTAEGKIDCLAATGQIITDKAKLTVHAR